MNESVNFRHTLKQIPFIDKANTAIKSYIQERKAIRSLVNYRDEANHRGIVCPQGAMLQASLRKRLVSRSHTKHWPKPKGKLHVFLAYSVSNWETILPKALMPFGKVTAFEWRSQGFDHKERDWLKRRDAMNTAMLRTFDMANREEPVDAVVGYLSGTNTDPEILKEMARCGSVIFNFCFDDKLNFPGKQIGGRYTTTAAIAHVVDLNLTNALDSIIKYAVHGGLATLWPEAALPEIHRPYDLPLELEVSFVGGCYGRRPAFIRKLNNLGVKVECFGNGWPKGPLSEKEMIKLYSRSKINLGFAEVGFSRKLMCLKGRDFEVPMSGGLYLTRDNPELAMVYDVGTEILTYQDEKDCAEKIRWLLASPEKAEKIREAGRKRALRDHTWERRFEEIFRLASLME